MCALNSRTVDDRSCGVFDSWSRKFIGGALKSFISYLIFLSLGDSKNPRRFLQKWILSFDQATFTNPWSTFSYNMAKYFNIQNHSRLCQHLRIIISNDCFFSRESELNTTENFIVRFPIPRGLRYLYNRRCDLSLLDAFCTQNNKKKNTKVI